MKKLVLNIFAKLDDFIRVAMGKSRLDGFKLCQVVYSLCRSPYENSFSFLIFVKRDIETYIKLLDARHSITGQVNTVKTKGLLSIIL